MRHHLANWLRLTSGEGATFTVNLDLGGEQPSLVTLRAGGGDIAILYEVFAERAYDISDAQLPPESVNTVVDCGAHVGLTALYFAHRYPRARVIAVEPNPNNFRLLVANTAHESRIFSLQACLSDRSGVSRISTDGPGWGHKIGAEGVEVAAVTLEDVRRRFEIDTIDLLKIDIEGAEKAIFASGICNVRAIAAELHGDYTIDCFAHDVAPRKVSAHVGQDTVLALPRLD